MKNIAMLLVICSIFLAIINLSYAATKNFTVEGRQKVSYPIELMEGDRFSGEFIVSGKLEIDFYVVGPNGNVVGSLNFTGAGYGKPEFTASVNGQYTFCFDNPNSDQAKTVIFNYNVQHYILGVPQELFLVGVIVVVIMICLIGFVALSSKP